MPLLLVVNLQLSLIALLIKHKPAVYVVTHVSFYRSIGVTILNSRSHH